MSERVSASNNRGRIGRRANSWWNREGTILQFLHNSYRALHLPQNGGGIKAYLAYTPWDTLLLALVGKV